MLSLHTSDGKLEIDNNLVKNAIRPLVLGRKNYLFAGSHEAAQRIAMFYSFFGTCTKNDVNPYQWLKKSIGFMAVVVDPINDNAVNFYGKYGFISLPNSDKMFLTMKVIGKLFYITGD